MTCRPRLELKTLQLDATGSFDARALLRRTDLADPSEGRGGGGAPGRGGPSSVRDEGGQQVDFRAMMRRCQRPKDN